MSSFSGPLDIYDELVQRVPENEEWLLGLLAFATIEEQKIEWMKHHIENTGAPPLHDDIQGWYRQQPGGVLLRAKDTAEARLADYAREAINIYMEEFEKNIVEGVIVGEIRELKKFWPQFGVNIVGGLASSVLFAALLTIFAFLILNDSSPVALGAQLGLHSKESSDANGQ
jgi:hypothetical protein